MKLRPLHQLGIEMLSTATPKYLYKSGPKGMAEARVEPRSRIQCLIHMTILPLYWWSKETSKEVRWEAATHCRVKNMAVHSSHPVSKPGGFSNLEE